VTTGLSLQREVPTFRNIVFAGSVGREDTIKLVAIWTLVLQMWDKTPFFGVSGLGADRDKVKAVGLC
jgi:hypothetical protein